MTKRERVLKRALELLAQRHISLSNISCKEINCKGCNSPTRKRYCAEEVARHFIRISAKEVK